MTSDRTPTIAALVKARDKIENERMKLIEQRDAVDAELMRVTSALKAVEFAIEEAWPPRDDE